MFSPKPRPKARFKIGERYSGEKTSFIAQGYVIFKEWDAEDQQYYYWEEWELTGFDNYDSWVEFDHYSQTLTVYEPVRAKETYDVKTLTKGEEVKLTLQGETEPIVGTVKEIGTGTVARLEGKMSYQLFNDDVIHYAEVKTGPKEVVSIEDYRQVVDRDYDYYKGRVLNHAEQKKLFGKHVAPISNLSIGSVIVFIVMMVFFLFPIIMSAIPQYKTVCTPRSVPTTSRYDAASSANSSSPTSTSASDTTGQNCQRVRVYGGGGGGVGK